MEKITNGKHTFEVVDFVPKGYEIWNIGKNMIEGYLPIAEQGNEKYSVNLNTLKAIKVSEAQTILSAVGGGQYTIKDMEIYCRRYKNAKEGTWSYKQVKRMKKALPIMRTIKGL